MPSIFSRKPCTKCWRACSPSVTMSTPASSCSLTASMVASRLARASSAPEDFQGAHNVLGSASHSGFGSGPALVVGNSMRAFWSVLIECLSAMSYDRGTVTTKAAQRRHRKIRQGTVRRGGAKEHARPGREGDGGREVTAPQRHCEERLRRSNPAFFLLRQSWIASLRSQ